MSTSEGRRYVKSDHFTSLKDHVQHVVRRRGHLGATTPEVVRIVNSETPDTFTAYSNPVSGALSRLHNVDGKIVRLREKRDGFNVYVSLFDIAGRGFYPARPPNGMEGDRLTPFLVLEVINGIAGLAQKYPKDTLPEMLNRIWFAAKAGDVADIQQAADEYIE